jgi:hypothetical protein
MTRIGVGAGVIAWGVLGLYLSDRAEDVEVLKPTKQEKAAVDKYIPRLEVIDKPNKT